MAFYNLRYLFVGACALLFLYQIWSYVSTPRFIFPRNRQRNSAHSILHTQKQFASDKKITKSTQESSPVNHIAFLKIHKAASSTVANIFLRYGYENHLVIAVPRISSSGGTSLSSPDFYPPPEYGTYDISCAHVPYNRKEFNHVLPSDTTYIGILREPFSQFQSFVRCFLPANVVHIKEDDNPVLYYLNTNETEANFERATVLRRSVAKYSFNFMANEFGFPRGLFFNKDEAKVQSYLEILDQEMDIVLIVEYLDESLVLMRRLLNWDLRHILYLTVHHPKHSNPRLKFGTTEEKLFRVKSYLDYALYEFFLHKLQDSLKRQQSDFYEELAYFRKIRSQFETYCMQVNAGNISTYIESFLGSKWNQHFVVTPEQCQ
ncbi:galactose-3-O-sulfotransferase 2-like [Argopecten irradians]|uniref:galactose-3-O-sulfotransferase 2-like n=1 Tax=Argopecten irradians TaxID=31199 RepID=UPI0037177456